MMKSSFFCLGIIIFPCTFVTSQCTLCSDGSNATLLAQVLPAEFADPPYNATTCKELAASTALANLSSSNETCFDSIQRDVGIGICGCPVTPSGLCTLCEDKMPAPDLTNGTLPDGTTCLSAAQRAPSLTNRNTDECKAVQADGFLSCGCTTIPRPAKTPLCNLCWDGSVPIIANGTLTTPQEMRCDEAFTLVQYLDNATECSAVQAEAIQQCGCPVMCTLCKDGSAPPNPIARFSTGAQALTCQAIYERQPLALPQSNCSWLQMRGEEICSCESELNPPSQCDLCEETNRLPYPRKESFGGRTCAESNVDARRDTADNCVAWQATAGVYCDCPNGNPLATANMCKLCTNKDLPNHKAILPSLQNGKEVTCAQLELAANVNNKSECNETRTLFRDFCCNESLRPVVQETSAAVGLLFYGGGEKSWLLVNTVAAALMLMLVLPLI